MASQFSPYHHFVLESLIGGLCLSEGNLGCVILAIGSLNGTNLILGFGIIRLVIQSDIFDGDLSRI